ncbi:MAG TPA: branched-chain amino acid ABC transporter permease [Bryobacteraceae bacterium]|nr:branched-chain amino acid ABC transporter permease [Bryobacteraceae bacterium]
MSKTGAMSLVLGLAVTFLAVFGIEALANDYVIAVICFVGLNIILAVSLNITNGLGGLFSLGHPAFMAIGGYVAAIMTFHPGRKASFLPDLPAIIASQQWPLFPSVFLGGAVAAIVAAIFGYPILRLKGHYLAVGTLALIIIVKNLIVNADGLTRGALGINGLRGLTNLWWVAGWTVVVVLFAFRLKFSLIGRRILAMREDELAAASSGVYVAGFKSLVFVIGAFFAGVAGGLWAHLVSFITPDSFSLRTAFSLVVKVVIGGRGSITGSVLGAIIFTVLTEIIRPVETQVGVYGISQVITGLVLLAVLLRRPIGLFGSQEPEALLRLFTNTDHRKEAVQPSKQEQSA